MPFQDRPSLIDRLVNDLRPVKVMGYARAYALSLATIASTLLLAFALSGTRSDLTEKSLEPNFLTVSIATTAALLLSLGGAIALALPSQASTWRRHLIGFGIIPLFLGIAAWAMASEPPPSILSWHDAKCGLLLVGFAAIPYFTFIRQISKLAPFKTGRTALGLGLSALGAGILFLQGHCQNDAGAHLAVWHFFPAVPVALISAITTHPLLKKWQR